MLRVLIGFVLALAISACATNQYQTPAQLMALSSAEVQATLTKGTEMSVYEDSFTVEQPLAKVFATMVDRTRVCWQMKVVIGGVAHTLDIDPFAPERGYAMFTARYIGMVMVVTQLVPLGANTTIVKSRAVAEYWRLPVIRDWVSQPPGDCIFTAEQLADDREKHSKDRSRH